MKKINYIIICTLFFISSCSLFQSSPESTAYSKSSDININFSIKNWIQKKNEFGADLVYENVHSKSLIIINSNCRKNLASSLSTLKESILSGIEKIEIQKEEKNQIFNRESLVTDFSGNLDGVSRAMTLTVFQRDFCIYDVILIAKNISTRDSEKNVFQTILNNVFKFGN